MRVCRMWSVDITLIDLEVIIGFCSLFKLERITGNDLFLSVPEMCVKALVNLLCLQTTHGIDSDC